MTKKELTSREKDGLELVVNFCPHKLERSVYVENKKRFMKTLDHTFIWNCNRELWLFYE